MSTILTTVCRKAVSLFCFVNNENDDDVEPTRNLVTNRLMKFSHILYYSTTVLVSVVV